MLKELGINSLNDLERYFEMNESIMTEQEYDAFVVRFWSDLAKSGDLI